MPEGRIGVRMMAYHGGSTDPEALIIVVAARGAASGQVHELAVRWQAVVPRAEFVAIDVDVVQGATDPVILRRLAAAAAASRSLRLSQIVAFGMGDAGRIVLDLVIRGRFPGAGMLGIDMALWPPLTSIPPTAAMIRLVQHESPEDPGSMRYHALVEAIELEGVDIRSMILPEPSTIAREATLRAGAAFLMELVASASRLPTKTRSAS
jgi:hypothetical protein